MERTPEGMAVVMEGVVQDEFFDLCKYHNYRTRTKNINLSYIYVMRRYIVFAQGIFAVLCVNISRRTKTSQYAVSYYVYRTISFCRTAQMERTPEEMAVLMEGVVQDEFSEYTAQMLKEKLKVSRHTSTV